MIFGQTLVALGVILFLVEIQVGHKRNFQRVVAGALAVLGLALILFIWLAASYHADPTGQTAGVLLTPDSEFVVLLISDMLPLFIPLIGVLLGVLIRHLMVVIYPG